MNLRDIEMEFGPRPLPSGAIDSAERDLVIRDIRLTLINNLGVYQAYVVTDEYQDGNRVTWLHTYWNQDLVGQNPLRAKLSTDGENLYSQQGRTKKPVSLDSNRRVISYGLRTAQNSGLLLGDDEISRYNPNVLLQNGTSQRITDRQRLFVIAEIPKGIRRLYVIGFAPLAFTSNRFSKTHEDALVYDPVNLSLVRRGLFFGNGSFHKE